MKNYFRVSTACDIKILEDFCNKCAALGYTNNSSIDKLKFNFVKENNGLYHYAFYKNKLVSLAGCHHLPEVENNAYRIAFRGVQLPNKDVYQGLSKNHFNSIVWRVLLNYQIHHCTNAGAENFYITTNIKDSLGRIPKTDKIFKLLSDSNIVDNCGVINIFNTEQRLWKLNLEKYDASRAAANVYQIRKKCKFILHAPGEEKLDANPIPILKALDQYLVGDPYPIVDKLLDKHGTDRPFYVCDSTVEEIKERFPFADIEVRMPRDKEKYLQNAIKQGNERMMLEHVDYWFHLPKTPLYIKVRDIKYNNPWFGFPTYNQWEQKLHLNKTLEEIWKDKIDTCINTILIPGLMQ